MMFFCLDMVIQYLVDKCLLRFFKLQPIPFKYIFDDIKIIVMVSFQFFCITEIGIRNDYQFDAMFR